jgi:hypothetical protein
VHGRDGRVGRRGRVFRLLYCYIVYLYYDYKWDESGARRFQLRGHDQQAGQGLHRRQGPQPQKIIIPILERTLTHISLRTQDHRVSRTLPPHRGSTIPPTQKDISLSALTLLEKIIINTSAESDLMTIIRKRLLSKVVLNLGMFLLI